MICDYQELSFTIFVTNGNQNVTQLGPYHHRGPDAISQTISSGLETGNEYRLWASVQLITGPVTSDELTFGKCMYNVICMMLKHNNNIIIVYNHHMHIGCLVSSTDPYAYSFILHATSN